MPWRCRSPSNASGAEGAVITGPAIPTYDVSAIGLYILDILGQPIEAIPPGGRAFYIDEINLAVAGRSDPDEVARFFLDRGVKVCALTMGGEGSLIVSVDGSRVRMPAFAVSISDTSGCGDSYTAGFIAGLHRGWNLEECARFATATSGLVATGLGSNANLVSFEATLQAMLTLPARAP